MNQIRDESHLEDLLSEPNERVIETLARLDSDILFLGVDGKIGPSLARMAKRASDQAGKRRRIIGAARFRDPSRMAAFQTHGIETVTCDLLDSSQLAGLPDAPNVLYLAGKKFGSTGQESLTWALNCYLPALVSQRFAKSRIVAYSTGNVYGLSPVARGGSRETDLLNPRGEYAMSCVGRERMFEHLSRTNGTPMAILRLNYATEMRYGVLADLARQVWAEQPIDLTMGHVQTIWQGDANAMALCALTQTATPPQILNLVGAEVLSVRGLALELGRLLNKPVRFTGTEAADALLSNGELGHELLGSPRVGIECLLQWTADWVRRGGSSLNKPTHFEVRDGRF